MADLSSAIRPYIDPTVPNPGEEVKRLRAALELQTGAQQEGEQAKSHEEEDSGPGLVGILEEALLD